MKTDPTIPGLSLVRKMIQKKRFSIVSSLDAISHEFNVSFQKIHGYTYIIHFSEFSFISDFLTGKKNATQTLELMNNINLEDAANNKLNNSIKFIDVLCGKNPSLIVLYNRLKSQININVKTNMVTYLVFFKRYMALISEIEKKVPPVLCGRLLKGDTKAKTKLLTLDQVIRTINSKNMIKEKTHYIYNASILVFETYANAQLTQTEWFVLSPEYRKVIKAKFNINANYNTSGLTLLEAFDKFKENLKNSEEMTGDF